VWLIFVLVVLWTGFPPAFAAIASTLYIPLTLAALGIIARGSAFAFRHTVTHLGWQRVFGAGFALSSVLTPFFFGTVAGGIASGRVPPGIAKGDVVHSWVNPTSMLGGVLAVGACAYLAAVFLCADAMRQGEAGLAGYFRVRGLATAVAVGAVGLVGIAVIRSDAPRLADGLTGRGLPLVLLSGVAGIASMALLYARRYGYARVAAGLAVTAVIWGWAIAQYPDILPGQLSLSAAAAGRATLVAMLVSLAIGSTLLVPALYLLYTLFQRPHPVLSGHGPHGTGGGPSGTDSRARAEHAGTPLRAAVTTASGRPDGSDPGGGGGVRSAAAGVAGVALGALWRGRRGDRQG
ncbi:MAG TPA: cytochrome d ubiquinol oxidase subunit II, partial [Mycobacteriales bacterium]|nr:cytochrome d ubiquinol oxidase subunit II [Mycobacteriales bacterium]